MPISVVGPRAWISSGCGRAAPKKQGVVVEMSFAMAAGGINPFFGAGRGATRFCMRAMRLDQNDVFRRMHARRGRRHLLSLRHYDHPQSTGEIVLRKMLFFEHI